MYNSRITIIVGAFIVVACGITQANVPMATEEEITITQIHANTKTITSTITHTNTIIILPTMKSTPTQLIAQNLGIRIDEVKEAFGKENFTYSTPSEINGLEYVKGQSSYGRMLELYTKDGWLINAEASIENHGPQTNPSILFLLLETIQKDPNKRKSIERWLDQDAPGDADKSPLMEVTYIDEDNIFYTYAHDKGYTRNYLKIYVLTWLIDMNIVK
jgi:hypothetical protein